jgi:D-alanine transaminase
VTHDHTRSSPFGRIAYVNGRYVPHAEACVHIEDRGLQFADSVYEVCAVLDGHLIDEEGHTARLGRSLNELQMPMPMGAAAIGIVMREVVRRNRLRNGLIYLQVTRGAYRRDHVIPANPKLSLMMTARSMDVAAVEKRRSEGIAVVTLPDLRWGRCDIKTTGLLPNTLAKSEARKRGAFEAWLVDGNSMVTEGTSANAWIVTDHGVLVTRNLSHNILAGVTRAGVLTALKSATGIPMEERSFSVDEALGAKEAFITSASGGVIPVVSIDGKLLGDGKPGAIARKVHDLYSRLSQATAHA